MARVVPGYWPVDRDDPHYIEVYGASSEAERLMNVPDWHFASRCQEITEPDGSERYVFTPDETLWVFPSRREIIKQISCVVEVECDDKRLIDWMKGA